MKKVSIYRNLHNGLLSIKHNNVVIGHCSAIMLVDTAFKVNLNGVERIRKENKKSVVATVNGFINTVVGFKPYKGRSLPDTVLMKRCSGDSEKILFNPYKNYSFIDYFNNPVYNGLNTYITCNGTIENFN
jgi:hypothetical protein